MTTLGYPDLESFAYAFERGELSLGPRIFTAISNVKTDQPTKEGAVKGTRSYPLKRTPGSMDLGDGTVTFSDIGERTAFIVMLGNGYRERIWTLKWVLTAPGAPLIRRVAYGCRVLGDPDDHSSGEDALGGDLPFSFMYSTINGLVAHSGLQAPTR
jgi:hypothetical protein